MKSYLNSDISYEFDEAKIVAEHCGTDHKEIMIDYSELINKSIQIQILLNILLFKFNIFKSF